MISQIALFQCRKQGKHKHIGWLNKAPAIHLVGIFIKGNPRKDTDRSGIIYFAVDIRRKREANIVFFI